MYLFFLTFLLFFTNLYTSHGVTVRFDCGRLGDKLLLLTSAISFAYRHKLPLFYPAFQYCDELSLDSLELYDTQKHHFDVIKEYSEEIDNNLQHQTQSTLIIISFYNRPKPDLKDKKFRKKMQTIISPKQHMPKIAIPENHLAVALHIRTGGGFAMDTLLHDKYPLLFVPLDFYVDQLNYLTSLYPEKKLYVYLFTDDQHPEQIIDYLKTKSHNKNIDYGFRTSNNQHNKNVLEDFFAMMHFKILIRPVSNFSKMADYLGHASLVIAPATWKKINNHVKKINAIRIIKKKNGIAVATETISYRS
jgi:hypothetical protein